MCSRDAGALLAVQEELLSIEIRVLPGASGLLRLFTSINCIQSCFDDFGEPDPWGSVIYHLWADFMKEAEEEWNALGQIGTFHSSEPFSFHFTPD